METTEAATGRCLPVSLKFSISLFYIIEHNEVLLDTLDGKTTCLRFQNISECHGN